MLSHSPWIRFPYPGQWGGPIFTGFGVVACLAGALSAMVESVGPQGWLRRLAGPKSASACRCARCPLGGLSACLGGEAAREVWSLGFSHAGCVAESPSLLHLGELERECYPMSSLCCPVLLCSPLGPLCACTVSWWAPGFVAPLPNGLLHPRQWLCCWRTLVPLWAAGAKPAQRQQHTAEPSSCQAQCWPGLPGSTPKARAVLQLGDYYAAARISGAPVPPPAVLGRAVAIQGFSCICTGFWGEPSAPRLIATLTLTLAGALSRPVVWPCNAWGTCLHLLSGTEACSSLPLALRPMLAQQSSGQLRMGGLGLACIQHTASWTELQERACQRLLSGLQDPPLHQALKLYIACRHRQRHHCLQ